MSDPGPTRSGPPAVPETRRTVRAAGRDVPVRTIVLAAVALYAVLFILFNDEDVKVDFVFFSAEIGLVWALLLAAGLGAVLGYGLPRLAAARRKP